MYGIDIKDSDQQGVLTVGLLGILQVLDLQIRGWHWGLHYLWGVGALSGPLTIIDYEEMAAASHEYGCGLTKDQVNLLARETDQTIDAVFTVNRSKKLKKYASDLDLYRNNELVIEANDSSYWRVVSHHASLIAPLRDCFRLVSSVDFQRL